MAAPPPPRRTALCAATALSALALAGAAGENSEMPWSMLPPVCPGCLAEPLETDYFGGTLGGEPRRLRRGGGDGEEGNETAWRKAFHEAAIQGVPLIIEGASEGSAMEGWSCDRFAEEFPEARMRREYDWVKNPDDKNLQSMGTASWISAAVKGEGAKERLSQDAKAPPFAPFYWGVREHRNGDLGSKDTLEKVRKLITSSIPSFMDKGNAETLFNHAEFWLGAKGTGARAHMDSHCIGSLSVVLSGERRWRIGPPPRLPKGAGRTPDGEFVFDDGVAYRIGWKPMFEFTLKAGEAVFFPPGWVHETLNTAEGCTVALTTQFSVPKPVGYFRSFYNRLRKIGDLHPCWAQMISWGSLGTNRLPMGGHEDMREQAQDILMSRDGDLSSEEWSFYDLNADGTTTFTEFTDGFAAWAETERAAGAEKKVPDLKFDLSFTHPNSSASDASAASGGAGAQAAGKGGEGGKAKGGGGHGGEL